MSDRYSRQVMLPEFGAEAQARLRAATILVVGAGGLGCPVLSYLAAAGIGRIVLVDHDSVAESNLHRQPLYRMADVGRLKVEAARDALAAANPDSTVEIHAEPLTPDNATAFVGAAEVVIDAADSFAVTYTLSDCCLAAGKPLVSASVTGLSGYAGVFCGGAPSYRAVFPDMPDRVASCATDGVLGTVVAIIGGIEAHFALQLAAKIGPAPNGRMLTFDARKLGFGGFTFLGAPEPEVPFSFIGRMSIEPNDLVVDLRSFEEAPVSPLPGAVRLPAERITELSDSRGARVVLCCRTGVRAARAAKSLTALGVSNLALLALG